MSSINLTGNSGITHEADTGRLNRLAETERAGDQTAVVPAASSSATAADDVIRVSEQAAAIGRLTEKVAGLPDIRQEKVERLREQVRTGSFNPTAEEIADAIIRDEQF